MKIKIFIAFMLTPLLLTGCLGCEKEPPPPDKVGNQDVESIFDKINRDLLYGNGKIGLSYICTDSETTGITVEVLRDFLSITPLPPGIPDTARKYSIEFVADRGEYTELVSGLSFRPGKDEKQISVNQKINIHHKASMGNENYCIDIPQDFIETRKVQIRHEEQEAAKRMTKEEEQIAEKLKNLTEQEKESLTNQMESYMESLGYQREDLENMSEEEMKVFEEKARAKFKELMGQ